MNVSAIINYVIIDPIKARFAVGRHFEFIENQGLEVLRNVCAQFPYRENDPNLPSLLADSKQIGIHLKELLNDRCKIAGVIILRMELMEFSYHAEVAANLL